MRDLTLARRQPIQPDRKVFSFFNTETRPTPQGRNNNRRLHLVSPGRAGIHRCRRCFGYQHGLEPSRGSALSGRRRIGSDLISAIPITSKLSITNISATPLIRGMLGFGGSPLLSVTSDRDARPPSEFHGSLEMSPSRRLATFGDPERLIRVHNRRNPRDRRPLPNHASEGVIPTPVIVDIPLGAD